MLESIRFRLTFLLLSASSLFTPFTLAASERASTDTTSVYSISPATDGSVITVSALGNLLPFAYASKLIHPRCPCDPNEVNALDRHVIGNHNRFLDSTSDVTAAVAALAPIMLDYLDLGARQEFLEDMTVYVETISVSGAFNTLAKYTAQRPLPVVYAGQAPDLINAPGGYRSFYSGHTTLTFSALSAASMTLNLRHHVGALPWIITGAIGTSVAAERVAAGRHFYTDVAVGALAGLAVGITVPYLHEKHSSVERQVAFIPVPDGGMLAYTRRF